MHAHQGFAIRGQFAMHQRQVSRAARLVAEGDQAEVAMRRAQRPLGHLLDQGFILVAIMDQVGNRADFQIVFAGEFEQIGQARHAAVILHDLADDRGRRQAGQRGQVAAGFGMACAHQHAALLRFQRKNMARLHDIKRLCRLGHGDLDRLGAVGGGNTGGDALGRLDRDGEVGAEGGAVAARHHRQIERIAAFLGQGQADQAARMLDHEVDGFWRDEIGGEHQVAFIFAVFLINQNDHAASAQFGDNFFGAGNRHVDPLLRNR